jgi:hypothetical protein
MVQHFSGTETGRELMSKCGNIPSVLIFFRRTYSDSTKLPVGTQVQRSANVTHPHAGHELGVRMTTHPITPDVNTDAHRA